MKRIGISTVAIIIFAIFAIFGSAYSFYRSVSVFKTGGSISKAYNSTEINSVL